MKVKTCSLKVELSGHLGLDLVSHNILGWCVSVVMSKVRTWIRCRHKRHIAAQKITKSREKKILFYDIFLTRLQVRICSFWPQKAWGQVRARVTFYNNCIRRQYWIRYLTRKVSDGLGKNDVIVICMYNITELFNKKWCSLNFNRIFFAKMSQ